MNLKFNRKVKRNQVGVRLTDEELKAVKRLAERNKTSLMETCGVLIRAALKEINKKYG